MPSGAEDWIAGLSPWPDEFGLERMRTLLARLGEPQRAFPSIHVVGTNGKTTATRTIEALLAAEGLHVGAYTSPHVRGWAERIRIGGEDADFGVAVGRVRRAAAELEATQFEVLTAAAFTAFARAEVDVAAVEAGLGGRLDATNVIDAPVVLLTNVSLEHTEVLGETAEQIAREKLAVAHAARIVVASDNSYRHLLPPAARLVRGGAREAAEAFLGRRIARDVEVSVPGRLERRGNDVWDGAHTPEAADWLLARLPRRDYVLVVSILRDKDAPELLRRLAPAGGKLVATRSSSPRALPAEEVARLARAEFAHVDAVTDPEAALERAHELGDAVLVTGSLYLVADLWGRQEQRVP